MTLWKTHDFHEGISPMSEPLKITYRRGPLWKRLLAKLWRMLT